MAAARRSTWQRLCWHGAELCLQGRAAANVGADGRAATEREPRGRCATHHAAHARPLLVTNTAPRLWSAPARVERTTTLACPRAWIERPWPSPAAAAAACPWLPPLPLPLLTTLGCSGAFCLVQDPRPLHSRRQKGQRPRLDPVRVRAPRHRRPLLPVPAQAVWHGRPGQARSLHGPELRARRLRQERGGRVQGRARTGLSEGLGQAVELKMASSV